jgi:hypothetical protein
VLTVLVIAANGIRKSLTTLFHAKELAATELTFIKRPYYYDVILFCSFRRNPTSNGAIELPLRKPLPVDLIKNIVKLRIKETKELRQRS